MSFKYANTPLPADMRSPSPNGLTLSLPSSARKSAAPARNPIFVAAPLMASCIPTIPTQTPITVTPGRQTTLSAQTTQKTCDTDDVFKATPVYIPLGKRVLQRIKDHQENGEPLPAHVRAIYERDAAIKAYRNRK